MTLRVELVVPDRRVWSGEASLVIAKTLDGDIGVLTGHPPVIGVLAEGNVVRILDPQSAGQPSGTASGDSAEGQAAAPEPGSEIAVAVSDGFLSVSDDRVSILAGEAQLGTEVDTGAARSDLEAALAPDRARADGEEPAEAKYARALLRAAGEQA